MKLIKLILLTYLQLYCKVENSVVKSDHRNHGHGFIFGTLVWSVVFLAIAHILNYQNWVIPGLFLATTVSFLVAFAWEKYQERDPNKRFSYRDGWASNFWFLPLYIFKETVGRFSKKSYNQAKEEFKIWWVKKGRIW